MVHANKFIGDIARLTALKHIFANVNQENNEKALLDCMFGTTR